MRNPFDPDGSSSEAVGATPLDELGVAYINRLKQVLDDPNAEAAIAQLIGRGQLPAGTTLEGVKAHVKLLEASMTGTAEMMDAVAEEIRTTTSNAKIQAGEQGEAVKRRLRGLLLQRDGQGRSVHGCAFPDMDHAIGWFQNFAESNGLTFQEPERVSNFGDKYKEGKGDSLCQFYINRIAYGIIAAEDGSFFMVVSNPAQPGRWIICTRR